MSFRTIILILVVGVVCATGTFAEVPNYITYQGTLTDSSGNPITGDRSMQFSLYADSTGGTALWSEMQWTVEVNDGLFRTSLGELTTLPPSLMDGSVLWLGIQVSPDPSELHPRQPIFTIPYSFRSLEADHATHADTADFSLMVGSDGDWTISGDDVYRNIGNVGIGIPIPSYDLHVEGQAISGENSSATGAYSTINGGMENIATGEGSTVSGGGHCYARGNYSFVAGGGGYLAADSNSVIGNYSTIGGGRKNTISNQYATVSGGSHNTGSGEYSTISGGSNNLASDDYCVVGGGDNNVASHGYSTVGGGVDNGAWNYHATVGGGIDNFAISYSSTVSGGEDNDASGDASTVSGGESNISSGLYSAIGGGYQNKASGPNATVGGGGRNYARGDHSVVAGGGGATAADSNCARGNYSTIGGGRSNFARLTHTTISGGYNNYANDDYATVGGGRANNAIGYCATISGGDSNHVSAFYSTIGGGKNNLTGIYQYITVGGGFNNVASSGCGVIAGGCNNSVDGEYGSVGGGSSNVAAGMGSTIPGGMNNLAEGDYTVAMGRQAQAVHDGSFIWADGSGSDYTTTDDNQFLIRAGGGVGIGTNNPQHQLDVAGSIRAAGNMECVALNQASDIRFKDNIHTIDHALEKVSRLRGVTFDWNDNSETIGATVGSNQVGVIAQEVESVLPQLVSASQDGYKSVDYTKLTAVLIEAVKELNEQNQILMNRIEALERDAK